MGRKLGSKNKSFTLAPTNVMLGPSMNRGLKSLNLVAKF